MSQGFTEQELATLTVHQRRVFDFIEGYIGAPSSESIALGLGCDVGGLRLILAELSARRFIKRSRKGLYRTYHHWLFTQGL